MKIHRLIVHCGTLLLLIGLSGMTAWAYSVNYRLASAGRVSLNIYDADGHIVRELLHADPENAGKHTITWDGKDQQGGVTPHASACTWKLLATPNGLTASFRANLGGNYPKIYDSTLIYGATCFYDAAPLGSHETCSALTVDASGIYLGARQAENVAACIKLSKTAPTTRVWSCANFAAWTGAISLARDAGNTLYVLGNESAGDNNAGPYQVIKTNADQPNLPNGIYMPRTGTFPTRWHITGTDYFAKDLDVCDTNIVLAYPEAGRVRWVTSTGSEIKWQAVPAPQGVSIAGDGTVYVTTGTKIVTTTGAGTTDFATGLINPGRLDLDHSNGDVYVITGANHEFVQCYSSTGTLKRTYGKGMPTDGLYHPQRFHTLTDVTAYGDGNSFMVAEPYYVRRVIQVKSSDGSILKEWYGGLPWCPWVSPDPDNPAVVWVVGNSNAGGNGGSNTCMRLLVDYATGSYRIHSVYHLATGLACSWKVLKRKSTGVKYLCWLGDHDALPYLVKIDETHWRLMPVTSFGNTSGLSPEMKERAGTNLSYQWNDANGDGQPQGTELTFYPKSWWGWGSSVDNEFNYYNIPGNLYKVGVARWNANGAPVYGDFASAPPLAIMPAEWTTRAGIWSRYTAHDPATNMTYVELQNIVGWNTNTGYARLLKYDGAGKLLWQVGSYGDYVKNGMVHGTPSYTQPPAGSIHGVRHFPGRTHNCSVLLDFNGGWGNANYPVTYVYDDDGLWVGSLFDHVNPAQHMKDYWLQGDNAAGDLYTDPVTGAVTYYGSGENQIYIYSITGWDKWERRNGCVTDDIPLSPSPTALQLKLHLH